MSRPKKMSNTEKRQRAEQRRWWDAHIASIPWNRRRKASRAARLVCK
jgi:hypothetical protein